MRQSSGMNSTKADSSWIFISATGTNEVHLSRDVMFAVARIADASGTPNPGRPHERRCLQIGAAGHADGAGFEVHNRVTLVLQRDRSRLRRRDDPRQPRRGLLRATMTYAMVQRLRGDEEEDRDIVGPIAENDDGRNRTSDDDGSADHPLEGDLRLAVDQHRERRLVIARKKRLSVMLPREIQPVMHLALERMWPMEK